MADDRKTLKNEDGITVIKGGSKVDAGLFQAVQDAYANINNNGVAVILAVVVLFVTLAEMNSAEGPLELMKDALELVIKENKEAPVLLSLAGLLIKLLGFLITYKNKFIGVSWFWIPYFVKSSRKNMFISAAMSVLVLFNRTIDLLETIILANVYYLWVSVRSPTHKTIFLVLAVSLLVVFMELNLSPSKSSGIGTPPPPTPTPATRKHS